MSGQDAESRARTDAGLSVRGVLVAWAGRIGWIRARRALTAFGLLLAGLVTVLGVMGWSLARTSPGWWRHWGIARERTVERASVIENAMATQLFVVRPGAADWAEGEGPWRSEPWRVSLTDDDASAWLSGRLPAWLAAETDLPTWPEELSDLQIRFEPGRARLGVRLGEAAEARVVTATLEPVVEDDGSLWVKTTWVHVGRLPLPASWVLERGRSEAESLISEELPDEALVMAAIRHGFAMLAGSAAASSDPVLELGDRRRVRLLDVRIGDGWAELTLQTERREDAAAVATTP